MIHLILTAIYIISTVAVLVGFLFSFYYRKDYKSCVPKILGLLAFIQVAWFFNKSEYLDSLYDISFLIITYILLAKLGTKIKLKDDCSSCKKR